MTHIFYTNFSKNSFFVSANTNEKYNVTKEHCFACHDDKTCFLPNCRSNIIFIGGIKELLQKLDEMCVNYQHVDCLSTLFKYQISGKNVFKSGQVSVIVPRNLFSTSKIEEWAERPASRTKILEEKVQKASVELFPKALIEAYKRITFCRQN